MDIHEYQAKQLFRQAGMKTLVGEVVKDPEQAFLVAQKLSKISKSFILKAQIHAGGRGKAGGIQRASSPEEAKKLCKEMLEKKLVTAQTGERGKIVRQVFVEQACNIKKEFYLAFLLDRNRQCLSLIASSEGGISIEEVAHKFPEKIFKTSLDIFFGLLDFQIWKILKIFALPTKDFKKLKFLLNAVYHLMVEKEATLVEINPLVQTEEGELLPLDAKMTFDDNALFRQKEITSMRDLLELPVEEQKATKAGLSFVGLSGNIGCLVNGAGLAMATMDIVQLKGAKPANFLDVGGGVNDEKIDIAFQILTSDPQVKGILVNIFGGIVKCDLIARGLIKAIKLLGVKIPVVVRLEGTNSEEAKKLLNQSNLAFHFVNDLSEAAETIISLTKKSSGKKR